MMIMIISLKDAIRDFFTISSLHRELSPTRTLKWPGHNQVQITCGISVSNTHPEVARAQSSANHVRHICLQHAPWSGQGTIKCKSRAAYLSPTRTLKWPGHNQVQITCGISVSNTHPEVARAQSSANHVRHICLQHAPWSGQGTIKCKSRAAYRELFVSNMSCATWFNGTTQLLSLT